MGEGRKRKKGGVSLLKFSLCGGSGHGGSEPERDRRTREKKGELEEGKKRNGGSGTGRKAPLKKGKKWVIKARGIDYSRTKRFKGEGKGENEKEEETTGVQLDLCRRGSGAGHLTFETRLTTGKKRKTGKKGKKKGRNGNVGKLKSNILVYFNQGDEVHGGGSRGNRKGRTTGGVFNVLPSVLNGQVL